MMMVLSKIRIWIQERVGRNESYSVGSKVNANPFPIQFLLQSLECITDKNRLEKTWVGCLTIPAQFSHRKVEHKLSNLREGETVVEET